MCGIIGYTGSQNSTKIVFEGLQKLEYRGYDSSGIAVIHKKKIHLEKEAGKLINLENSLSRLPENPMVAIGHTRWATHGVPSRSNAHPHLVEPVVLIHNGIIENYKELKVELVGKGHSFNSETDTEIIAHLISNQLSLGMQPKEALINVLNKLEGAFALGILMEQDPHAIYLAKQGSPLVIGVGKGEMYFGSDVTTFAGKANRAIYLNDGECGRIVKEKIELWDFEGNDIPQKKVPVDYIVGSADKGGYRHYMLKEIHEQPHVMSKTISSLLNQATNTFNFQKLGLDKIDFDSVASINIIACGTAYLAGRMGKYLLEPLLKIPINVELASEFRYRDPWMSDHNLTIAISQSGETADTLACIKYARSHGAQIMSICNVKHSSIPRESDSTLYMEAGPEIGVASTKAFTAQILSLYLWGLGVASQQKKLSQKKLDETILELKKLPLYVDQAINIKESIKDLSRDYYEYSNFLYLGRGPSYPIALEGALKLKEISYIHAEGYSAGELKHGPIALVDKHMPLVIIAPQDQWYEKTISNLEEVRAREGVIIGIGAKEDTQLKSLCRHVIAIPQMKDPCFQAIISTIPIQFLSYYIAVKRGTDVDQPRNLAKSVTVE